MTLGKVRAGELLALLGAACVVVSLLLAWYEGSRVGTLDAWDTFGAGVVLLLAAAAIAIALFAATLLERGSAIPVALEVTAVPLALAALVAALVRLLERPQGASGVCAGAWLALAGAAAILAGAWLAMRDERRSLYRPADPDPRPRP